MKGKEGDLESFGWATFNIHRARLLSAVHFYFCLETALMTLDLALATTGLSAVNSLRRLHSSKDVLQLHSSTDHFRFGREHTTLKGKAETGSCSRVIDKSHSTGVSTSEKVSGFGRFCRVGFVIHLSKVFRPIKHRPHKLRTSEHIGPEERHEAVPMSQSQHIEGCQSTHIPSHTPVTKAGTVA